MWEWKTGGKFKVFQRKPQRAVATNASTRDAAAPDLCQHTATEDIYYGGAPLTHVLIYAQKRV